MIKHDRGEWKWRLILIGALFLAATAGFADEQNPRIILSVKGEKEVVQTKDGKKIVQLAPMDTIKSGDVLVYSVTYQNSGKSVAKDVTVINPIPVNTVYIPESAAGKDTKIFFSINGGATYQPAPVMQKIRDSAGKEIIQPAPPELFTHIKWMVQVPVSPNATGMTTFKVRVK
jgi:uncharacterized repeat protein (TIGR01451 family)